MHRELQPDFELAFLFPGRAIGSAPSSREIELFSEFWDDSESDEQNLEMIGHWVRLIDPCESFD